MAHLLRRLAPLVVLLASVTLVLSCGDSSGPEPAQDVTLTVNISLAAFPTVESVVVEVTAADIQTPLVFNLSIANGSASGSVTVPAGSQRTITVTAYDPPGIATHRGSVVLDIEEGTNPIATVTLDALQGEQPIEAHIGTLTVSIEPASGQVAVGGTLQLTATVVDGSNDTLSVQVRWATLNPALAWVDTAGVVTGIAVGDVQIVSTYAGVGAVVDIRVHSQVDALALVEVASGLAQPVYLTSPVGDERLFIVEQPGRIRIVQNGQLAASPFLDITGIVRSGGERGLLSMAFAPDYASSKHFYVSYTDDSGDTQIARYTVSGDPNVADPGSAKPILSVSQPFSNHNGGLIMFGPDGMLYIGLGDGGSGGDPQNHGQNLQTLLGTMLRIDVTAGDPYAIPADNPFVGNANGRDEIWAYGLRNPWRFAFDFADGILYIADVGQNAFEEVNAEPASASGLNYGWRLMEGNHCFNPSNCDQSGLTLPVVEYGHGNGCSVTGGFVYRGSLVPFLQGHYFYSDFCSGWLRSFKLVNGEATEAREWDVGSVGNVTSFGQDGAGELYVLVSSGRVYRIEAGS